MQPIHSWIEARTNPTLDPFPQLYKHTGLYLSFHILFIIEQKCLRWTTPSHVQLSKATPAKLVGLPSNALMSDLCNRAQCSAVWIRTLCRKGEVTRPKPALGSRSSMQCSQKLKRLAMIPQNERGAEAASCASNMPDPLGFGSSIHQPHYHT